MTDDRTGLDGELHEQLRRAVSSLSPAVNGVPAFGPSSRSADDCRCDPSFVEPTGTGVDDRVELVVDADDCPGGGDLAARPACRSTVVSALADRDADVIRTCADGRERAYVGDAAALLLAAGRFVERAAYHDERLADLAQRDPLRAAHDATGRADPVADIAAETGLAVVAAAADDYDDALRPFVSPAVAHSRVRLCPPGDATLVDRWTLDTEASVRLYDTDAGRRYHLDPVAHRLDDGALATLSTAAELLATGGVSGGQRAPGRAVRRVADDRTERTRPGQPTGSADAARVEMLSRELAKYTRGNGVLDDCFADARVSDVFVTAPVTENSVRVTVDGERLPTNVRLTPAGAAALASRLRRASGRSFSRANPTVDAVLDVGGGGDEGEATDGGTSVRAAGVTDPASDGLGFAFRRHDAAAWTLPKLVANDTLTASAAAFLSVAVERAAAGLVAGTRGAGKTTLLGALLWELPTTTRTVSIEDTPELPVETLQRYGRDVQPLYAGSADGDSLAPQEALHTALRLGEGALVVGEVRGEEAATLYEAMRVGASGSAVLGTIHGDGGAAVRERVVSDLGVAESAFGATDLLVTCRAGDSRHVARIEEVRVSDERAATDGDVAFEPLYEQTAEGLTPTGTVARGNSHLVASLAGPDETYADVRAHVDERETLLRSLATTERTSPTDVAEAYRQR